MAGVEHAAGFGDPGPAFKSLARQVGLSEAEVRQLARDGKLAVAARRASWNRRNAGPRLSGREALAALARKGRR